MTDALNRAVDARIDAYRPGTGPPFEIVQARKRARDRRRGAAAAGAVALAVGGLAFLPSLLSFGGNGPDRSPTVANGGGDDRAFFEYRIRADDAAAFRDAGPDALTNLEVCLQYPGLSDGVRLESDPPQFAGRVAGRQQADALVGCVETVPGMAATLTPAAPSREESAPAVTDRTETPSGNRWWVSARPNPDDRTLELVVHEDACASGQPATGRIRADVKYLADRITVTITVKNAAGFQACPGNPDTPFTLMLDEPVGDRVIYDGRTSPPSTAQKTYSP